MGTRDAAARACGSARRRRRRSHCVLEHNFAKDFECADRAGKNGLSTAFASKAVIENLPQLDGARYASPGALRQLAESARSDFIAQGALIDQATTPDPLRPALRRALLDAWSMTSLEKHTGRPDVLPWLRGWEDEEPQTTIVWRRHLPLHIDAGGRTHVPPKAELEDFLSRSATRKREARDGDLPRRQLASVAREDTSWAQAPCAGRLRSRSVNGGQNRRRRVRNWSTTRASQGSEARLYFG